MNSHTNKFKHFSNVNETTSVPSSVMTHANRRLSNESFIEEDGKAGSAGASRNAATSGAGFLRNEKAFKIKRSKDADATAEFMVQYDSSVPEITPAQEKKLVRKVSWVIVSLVTSINAILFFDKITMSYSSLFEFWEDTNLTQDRYSNANSLFYVGYIVGQLNLFFVQRYSIKWCFTILSFLWCSIMFLSCLMRSYQGVYLVRLSLGFVESTAFTMMNTTMQQFLTLEEKAALSNIWCIGCLGCTIPVGFIAYGVLHIKNPAIALWKIFTLIIACLTFLLALTILLIYPSNPTDARFLSIDEKIWVIRRVQRSTKASIEQKTLKMYQVKECLKDPVTWLFGFGMFFLMLCNNLGFQSQILYVSVGATSNLASTLISTAAGGFAVACGIVAYYTMKWYPKVFNNTFSIVIWTIPELVASIVMVALPWHYNKKIFIAMITIAQIYGVPWIQLITFSQQTASGYTKVMCRQGIVMIGYGVANIISPQLWRGDAGPRYYSAWIVQIVFSFVMMPLFMVIIWYILKRRNETRQAKIDAKIAGTTVDYTGDVNSDIDEDYENDEDDEVYKNEKAGFIEKEDGTKIKVDIAALDLTDLENDTFIYPL